MGFDLNKIFNGIINKRSLDQLVNKLVLNSGRNEF